MTAASDLARFREWLTRRLRPRGARSEVARALRRDRNWAGRIAKGKSDLPLGEALKLAEALGSSLGAVLKEAPPWHEWVNVPTPLALALRDPVIVGAVEALVKLETDYRQHTVNELRRLVKLPPIPLSDESMTETIQATNTKQGRAPRPSPRGSKARA